MEDNIGVDASIVPTLMDNIPMRDYSDGNKVWTTLVKILRSKMFDRDLQIKGVTLVYCRSVTPQGK